MTSYTVVGDRVFIKPDLLPDMTASGLHLALAADVPKTGMVVALGDGPVSRKGVRMNHIVRVGERVVFAPDSGEELFFETERIICMREDEILAVIEEKSA